MGRVTVVGLIAVAVLFLVAVSVSAYAAPDWMSREGSIYHAITLEDGSPIYLDAVIVGKIQTAAHPEYFTIHEVYRRKDLDGALAVVTPPSPDLRIGQNVDIQGVITTLPNGQRAVIDVTVWAYADKEGNILRHGPLIKGLLERTPWEWMVDVTVRPKTLQPEPISPISNEPNTTPRPGPVFYPEINDALSRVRLLATGDFIDLAAFDCKPILSTGVDQTYGNYFIMGEDSGPETLKTYYQTPVNTTDRVNKVSGQLREEDGGQVLCVDSGPGYDPQVFEGGIQTTSPPRIAHARTYGDGTTGLSISGVIVSANQQDFPDTLYVQETNRSGGIRVHYTGATIARGSIVDVTGTIGLAADGERVIDAGSTGVTFVEQSNAPAPMGLPNKFIGGSSFNSYTPGISNPAGSGTGLYNKGLLVKTWGKVTAVDVANKYFYIDDGTGFQDGSGNTGIKVSWAWSPSGKPSILSPGINWYVSVTGISSSDTADSGETYYRVLRPRDQNDLLVFSPADSTPPTITITAPSGGEIHIAPSQSTVQLVGTAMDVDTGVTSVQVGFTATGSQTPPTTWCPASYDDTTYVWTYNWQNPQTQRIWVKATDFAMQSGTTNRDVTVSTPTSVKYVRPGGTGTKDGSSWGNAEDKVGDALNITGVTEVWVAQGTYQERITLKSGVAVYGGFTPVATYREQRDWSANETILDGNQGGSVVTVPSGATSATTIDGFTIRNGSASYGAGIYSYYSSASATIANNIIRANSASYGGGLYANGSTLTIAGNIFVGNTASSYGGGIYYSNSSGQVVKIANNTVVSNVASDGGGIYLSSSSTDLSLANNIIAFNVGGGIYKSSGSPAFTKNDVYGNNDNGKYEYSWTTTYPVGTDLTPADPVIPNISSGDWHIAEASPCHDPQGTTLLVTMDKDIDTESRVYGSTVDIGADEWTGTDPAPVVPSVIYVKPSSQGGSDSNNGTSWALAVATVQKGIDLAYAAGGGEVWVAAGAYGKATMKSFVGIYGGFTIGDGSKSARNWKNNVTILDAASSGRGVTVSNAADCVVDGFTIRNGGTTNGSGVYCSNAAATIANNIIRGNNGSGYSGGGLYASGSTLTVAGNVFVDNKAYSGGGIYYTNTSGLIANNTILCNVANGDCGGIYLYSGSPAVSNNIITSNVGGGIYKSSGSPTFTKNDVYGNNANGKYEYSWTTTYPVGTDLVPADPVIPNIEWGDWHIADSSPCQDPSGTTLAVSMDKDIDAGDRTYGSTVDIGADEWNGTDPTAITPTVIYVKPSSQGGSDSNNGTTWALAVATVQKGIDLSYAAGGGEVWVAAGAYAKATMKSFVKVYGGFVIGDTSKSARDWKTNQTILDGGASGSVVTMSNVIGSQVDGFTIRNGSASYGGGVYCSSASATITNNIIRANNAGSYYGGGIYASSAALTVAGNVLVDNKASSGGGIYYTNAGGQIANNTIINNVASTDAGGIYLGPGTTLPSLSNNIVAYNAGGGIYKSSGSPAFTKNDVYGNNANGKYEYSWTTSYPVGTDLVPSDPVIPNIDWGDWHIADSSPCQDPSGTTLAVSMDKDIDTGSRVYGSTVDIGADEWNGSDPTPVTPSVIYVKPSSQGGSDSNNGTSWTLAVATVQKGIDLAYSAGNSEVWVAAGTYAKANVKSFVKVYGGFTIGDSSKSARDWKNNPTILDGGASGSVVSITSARGCVIDGFTIRNGGTTNGSGIYCANVSATIANNVIRANNASGYNGGGLYGSGSMLTVVGNVFVDNKASYGAGIYYYSNTGGQIANNTIISNAASSDCGGVHIYSGSPTLSNNIIGFNAGGGINKSSGSPTFVKNDVYGNSNYQYYWTTTYPVGTDLVPADPCITNIDWGDWHIAGASPCHDPQDTSQAVTMDKDIDVGDRVYGSTVDIGADEWSGTDPIPATPTVIYVKPSSQGGSDSNNGTSWALAVATVQKGIDLSYTAGGGEVWVAAGTYAKATMKSFVKLYGGFAVGDASKSARDWKNNPTILDGGASGSVVTISNSVGCQVDGFTIRNGSGYYYNYYYYGGGIYCSNASATIVNNKIRANTASTSGGGLYASSSSLTIVGNVFVDNKTGSGGGIYYTSTSGPIANNTIIDNVASSDGGGIYIYSGSPDLSNNIVGFNAGGGIYKSSGSPTFVKNDVFGNGGYQYSWTTTYPVGTDLVPVDPGITNIDWGDWHITGASPCHDPEGTTLAAPMDKDIDNDGRVYGSTLDIGADEWNGTDPAPVVPSVIYVKPSSQGGSDSNNGTSWSTAVATVQKGIDLSYAAGGGEVWVAAGTYAKATLKSFVKVYGGFTVGDTSKSARNWKTNQTILDGAASGSVVTMSSVVGCQVDGFIIRNGSASYGGGVNCTSALSTITNNIIRRNNASSYGGGIYASGSAPNVAGNVIIENKSGYYGGGIYYTNTSGQIANNTIICNVASSDCGGVYLNSGSPTLSNNIVSFNAGGGINKSSGSPTFVKNDVFGNGNYQYYWTTTYPVGTDLVPVDPGIANIDFGDWHIAAMSPCRDPQGTTLAVSMDKDVDAESRVYGSTVDIGADEWNGTDPTPTSPTVIYVKPSSQGGSDSNNGTTWALAVATVQKGIDLSYAAGGGEVWVATGTYAKATMKSFVKVYGGFAVNDAIKSARNWKNNPTILDGGTSGNTVNITSVVGCIVDGFTIRNGGTTNGSGIYCSNAMAAIANNIIRGNNGSGYSGGGLYASGSTLTVADNVFVDNKAYSGGGIYYSNTNGQIANNTIISNSASSDCGGIYLYSGSPTLSNNIVAFNVGGGIRKSSGSPTFVKNDVYGNNGNNKYEYSWTTSYPVGTDLVPADPVIPNIDWGDWHIAETSPCHDPEGTTLALSMEKDIDTGSRVYGSTVDIGADEWNGSDLPPVTPTVIYVKPSSQGGSDSNNGLSWTTAVATVQKGVDLAYGAGGGEVWVAAGTYAKATLKSFVRLCGGFGVGDASKLARDWEVNQTILDGGSSGRVVTIDTAVGCQVDGFIIRNGSANNGGGIYCSNASAIIENNIIRNNSCGSSYYGGGLYASNSILSVVGNVLLSNSAGYGGGIYYTGTSGQLANNTIIVNTGSSDCGGIYIYNASPALSNNIVANNVGGGIYKSSGSPTFAKNDVYGNNANSKYEYSWTTAYPVGTDLVPADPVIPNIGTDWHIAQGSPCINPEGTVFVCDKDIDCGDRVVGASVDIGADEWKGLSPKITLARSTSCSTVHATWRAYSGNVQNYYYAIGTSPTATDIRDWTDAGGSATLETTAVGLSLDQTATYYYLLKVLQTDQQWSEIDSKQIDIGPNKLTLSIGSLTQSPITVTATVKDHFDNPLDTVVHLSSNSGTIDTPDASTGSDGVVEVHVQDACLGELTVTAYIEDACGNRVDASASAAANRLSITAPPDAAANSTVAVTAAVKDSANNPVQGASISFSTDSGTLDSEQATTGSNGTVTVHVSGACAGTTTVTAYIQDSCENPITSSVSFQVHPDILVLSSQSGSVAAGIPVGIIATATNYQSSPVDRQIHFWTTAGTLDVTDGATGSDGQITTNLTCTTGGPVVVYASMDDSYPCGGRTTKAVLVNIISDSQISLEAAPGTGGHADRIMVTATVKDVAGNPVDRTVNFSVSSGTIDSSVQSGSDGIAEAYATYPSEGFLTVFAWVDDAGGNRKSCSLSFCTQDSIALDISPTSPAPGAAVTVNATITDFKGDPVDRLVYFDITVGSITPTSAQSGSDGLVSASTNCPTSGEATVTAYAADPGGNYVAAYATISSGGGSKTVGYLYYLQETGYGVPDIEAYLEDVCGYFTGLSYTRLDSSLSGLNECDVVFVAMPIQDLTSQQISALADFAGSQGNRLVLVGEHTPTFAAYNTRLNSLLQAAGVQVRYNTGSSDDNYLCYPQSCPINSEHELMNGVSGLWYDRIGSFAVGATAIAYGADDVPGPWLVEAETSGGGSVVCFHDSNFFGFGHSVDTVPNKNFKFIGNLCGVGVGGGRMSGPECFVPGHPNEIDYSLESTYAYGKIEIFERDSTGLPTGSPIYTSTSLDLSAGSHTFTYSGTEISCDPGRYVARLTYGPDSSNTKTYEMQFDVKCWDLVWLFEDVLTDEEKAAIDQAQMDIPDDYVEDEDPMVPEGPVERALYCAGIDASTVNSSKVTVKVWYWDEEEASSASLSIDNGISTMDITDEDWLNVWGQDVSQKHYYDERGSAISSLNSTFYSMTDSDQYFHVKVTVADDGVLDNAGNLYDADPSTPEIEKTADYKLKIDQDGNISVLEETYE